MRMELHSGLEELLRVEYTRWEKLLLPFQRAWYWIKDKGDHFRYRCQRFRRGYSDYDVLDIQMWLVRSVRPMLENILNHLYTHPAELTEEEWEAILREMIHHLTVMDLNHGELVRHQLGIAADDKSRTAEMLIEQERENARGKFFELFNRWYWDLRY